MANDNNKPAIRQHLNHNEIIRDEVDTRREGLTQALIAVEIK